MEVDFNKREKIVGIFIIGVTILLLTTVIIIGRGKDWFKKYIPYYTTFNESYNLQANSPVKLLDANIGKVKKITIVGDKVRVSLAILEEFKSRIRTNSVATVKSPTIIGAEYIYIIPGSGDAPLIQRGGEIPSKAKKSITDYLDEFQVEKTIKTVVEAVQNISAIVKTLNDPQGPLFTTFDRANKTLANIEKITKDIESGKGTVGGLLKTRDLLDQIHRNLDKVEDNLTILEKIENGVLENIPDIRKIVKDLTKSVEAIKIIVANIKKGSHDIPKVTQSASEGIYEIRSAVENIDKVVQSIQKNFLIKPNLPPEPEPVNVDSGLRP
jgi:phospholipid/cholesterol/gamma-HCH transport system substrate-binding protein